MALVPDSKALVEQSPASDVVLMSPPEGLLIRHLLFQTRPLVFASVIIARTKLLFRDNLVTTDPSSGLSFRRCCVSHTFEKIHSFILPCKCTKEDKVMNVYMTSDLSYEDLRKIMSVPLILFIIQLYLFHML